MKSDFAIRRINVTIKYDLRIVLTCDNKFVVGHTQLGQRLYSVLLI
jgi:hypothetical protein